ncbi:MAG: nucleotidyltransferase domain-containing protein [Promethearchaeota archaeon]
MVNKKLLKQIRKDFTRVIKTKKILGILLFGSRVNNMETNRSDIDICVVAPEENDVELLSFI